MSGGIMVASPTSKFMVNLFIFLLQTLTTLLVLSSSLYADNGKDFLSKDEREWLTENQSQITRAVETGYAPFVFIDSKDRPVGLANDYMLLLESKLGVHFKEKRFSKLNEIFDKLKSGEVHIVNAVTNSPARSKFITFTAPFISVPNVIIVQNKRAGSFKEETLNGLKVSLVKEYAVTEHFTNKGLSFTPYLVPDDITALYNVSSGHTDAAIIDLATASYLISTKGITNLRIAGETTFAIQLAMGTPVAEPMLNSIIQKGLAQITEAERKEIKNRWINVSKENFFADWRFWAVVIGALFALCAAIFGNFLWNRTLRHQVALRTEELSRETKALQELKEELQAQNEELAATEEELRSQNDELLEAQEALRESEFRWKFALEGAGDGVWDWNIQTGEAFYSQRYKEMLGFAENEIANTSDEWLKLIHPEDAPGVITALQPYLDGKAGSARVEYRMLCKDGSWKWIVGRGMVVSRDSDGKPLRMIGTNSDITERKQAETKLAESEGILRDILESTLSGFWDWNLLDNTEYLSPTFKQMFGYEDHEMENSPEAWQKIIFPDDLPGVLEVFDRHVKSLGREPFFNEIRYRHKDGSTVWVICAGRVIKWAGDGTPIRMVGCHVDITDRKRLEEEKHFLEQQFQQTQKLESLGVLAGGIAHDFNNILAIIMGYCSLTKMDFEDAEKHIPEIEKAAERAAALCRQMLAYAGKATLTQSQVNMRMLVDEMVSMLKTTTQQNVVIKPELGTDIPTITADASQLRQVVMNLIINAAEAIGDAEGEIDIKLAKAEIKADQQEKDHLNFIIPAGRYICFEVTDNGCGMDDESMRKIFEPFYTTKFTGRGLGMSAVLGIIKAHHGALQLESQLGHGTTFKVYLPVQLSKSETEEAHQKAVSATWHGSGTILLAEDEVQVKSIAIALLQKLGFTVIDAANGKEALELYQQNANDITMVVTDMGMPVMNGYELFYRLKQLDPLLPIIISSGFGEGDIASKIPHEEIAGLINKPYKFEQLRDVLRGVVEG